MPQTPMQAVFFITIDVIDDWSDSFMVSFKEGRRGVVERLLQSIASNAAMSGAQAVQNKNGLVVRGISISEVTWNNLPETESDES